MRMYTRGFNSMKDLNDYANAAGIAKDRIVSVFQSEDGTYLLVYYGE